jgi:20S proteasome alpha/beta subunit
LQQQQQQQQISIAAMTALNTIRRGGDDSSGRFVFVSMKGKNDNNDDDDNDKISSSSSIYNYIPITALDNYGRSKQLQHAMQSTKRYGTPIVACICCSSSSSSSSKEEEEEEDSRAVRVEEDVIVVCSLQRLHTRTGVIASTTTTTTAIPSPSIHGMVRILATKDDDEYNNNNDEKTIDIENFSSFQPPPPQHTTLQSAIVITGLGSDADYLTDKLRYHINKYWFRYDTTSSSSTNAAVVTKMTRDILLDCMGYNRNDETMSGSVSGGIGRAAGGGDNDDNDEDGGADEQQQQRAGRPLGICAFLLNLGSRSYHRSSSCITVIEANGVSEEYVAYAMGMGSEIANNELAKKWRRYMGQNEAIDMIKGILQGVAKERGWLEDSTTTRIEEEEEEVNEEDEEEEKNKEDDDERDADLMVVCEIVSSRGINIQYIKL